MHHILSFLFLRKIMRKKSCVHLLLKHKRMSNKRTNKSTRTQLRVPSLPPPAGPRGARAPRDPTEARFVPKPAPSLARCESSHPCRGSSCAPSSAPAPPGYPKGWDPSVPALGTTLVPPASSRCAAPARPSSGPSCSPAASAAEGNHPPPPPSFAF